MEFGRVFNHVIRRTGNSVDLAPDPPIAAAEKGAGQIPTMGIMVVWLCYDFPNLMPQNLAEEKLCSL